PPTADRSKPSTSQAAAAAERLVRQLGDQVFAKRQAAIRELIGMGARAAVAVRAGTQDRELEVTLRCKAIWPRLWATEIARADAERLAGCDWPCWVRFQKTVGDDAASRALFV